MFLPDCVMGSLANICRLFFLGCKIACTSHASRLLPTYGLQRHLYDAQQKACPTEFAEECKSLTDLAQSKLRATWDLHADGLDTDNGVQTFSHGTCGFSGDTPRSLAVPKHLHHSWERCVLSAPATTKHFRAPSGILQVSCRSGARQQRR